MLTYAGKFDVVVLATGVVPVTASAFQGGVAFAGPGI
jgi:hypothetical protein